MPRTRPPTTGYERLAQADGLSDDSDEEDLSFSYASLQHGPTSSRFAPISQQPRARSGLSSPKAAGSRRPSFRRRLGSNSGVDLNSINNRLERWAEEIASRFKRGKGRKAGGEDEQLEIHHSVFQAPDGIRPITAEGLAEVQDVMTKDEFDDIVESVRVAIEQEVHPRMISQGSSGSYFARNAEGKVVGVFKPKDEEPYAAGNPKWNKWIHRNLFPCFFGRACLIPNLSYVSEAAAYTLDCQLRTHMVPYTAIVQLSSKSFHYPFWDRHSFYRKGKPLPSKPGSFQVFLKGFKDANVFLREHPWPDQYLSGFRTNDAHRKRKRRWADTCRPTRSSQAHGGDSEDETDEVAPLGPDNFGWTETLKQSFREELEKLVILDYIMRNTDRGLDNWMIKVDWETQAVSIASERMHMSMAPPTEEDEDAAARPRPVDLTQGSAPPDRAPSPYNAYKTQKPMDPSRPTNSARMDPKISIGAIDNSLSWPWKHPDAWRSFPFGWLFLPVDLIGRPFSEKTRNHFLPLLTSTKWWSQTHFALRKVFHTDPDFQERMFAKQMAVMKGQAWNVVETLKTPDHGPLELTRRAKVCVYHDLVDVPVAVPMRSSELRRQASDMPAPVPIDELDIGASPEVSASAPNHTPQPELVGGLAGGLLAEMPNPGRFELTPSGEGAQSPDELSMNGSGILGGQHQPPPSLKKTDSDPSRPAEMPPRASYQGPSRTMNLYSSGRQPGHLRRFSFATGTARKSGNSIAQQLYGGFLEDDDIEGDLGYAVAEDMEGSQRKVIVERLEMVKAKNPVFSWC